MLKIQHKLIISKIITLVIPVHSHIFISTVEEFELEEDEAVEELTVEDPDDGEWSAQDGSKSNSMSRRRLTSNLPALRVQVDLPPAPSHLFPTSESSTANAWIGVH